MSVLTSDYGADRTGANLAETQLTPAMVRPGTFGLLGVFPVDGQIFAQPLYVSGLNIGGQPRNVLYAATEHNSVYAYDGDSAAAPDLLWRVNLGPAVPSSEVPTDASSGPFIDVNPEVGILSTPAIDLQAGVMYVVADILTASGPVFELHALDLATGEDRMNGPVAITAKVAGGGSGAVGNGIAFDPSQHIQRPGLLLANGAVYIAFGSHADFGKWHGWVMSYDGSDLTKQRGVFQTTPAGQGGAIWQAGRGLAADESGNIYFVTGNGDYDGGRNFSESFVRLSGNGLALEDWYTPSDWQFLTDNDLDLSAGPAFVPGTHWMIGGDKNGSVYLIDGDSMGRLDTADSARVKQAVGGWIFSFALWARPDTTYLYLRDTDGTLKSFEITDGTFNPSPTSTSAPASGPTRVGMALSANGSQDGTGILWVTSGDYFDSSVPAILHAFDASDLSNEIWNSAMAPADALGGFAKFATPTVVNGKVYAASSSAVMVYGLLGSAGTGQAPLPVIAAVENAASFAQAAISPGEFVSIFGANLGPSDPAAGAFEDSGNASTALAGVQVLVNGIPATVTFVSPYQVNAVIPFAAYTGTAQVQVVYQDRRSQPFSIQVRPVTPGLFAANGSGSGQALAINQDGTLNTSENPAQRNSPIILYATGAGRTTPSPHEGSVVPQDQPVHSVSLSIGGLPAQVLYAGISPGSGDGVLQINAIVPADVAAGPAVPVILRVGGRSSQYGLTLAVQ